MALENNKNDLISYNGQKRNMSTMEFKKTVVKFAIKNSSRCTTQKISVEPKRVKQGRENLENNYFYKTK